MMSVTFPPLGEGDGGGVGAQLERGKPFISIRLVFCRTMPSPRQNKSTDLVSNKLYIAEQIMNKK